VWKDGRRRPVACADSAAVWRTTGMGLPYSTLK
jgi:hypothetical protein